MKRLPSSVKRVFFNNLAWLIIIFVVLLCAAFSVFGTRSEDGSITLDGSAAKYSKTQKQALCELSNQADDAITGLTGIDVAQDSGSGCEPTDIPQLGSVPYYGVDVSTPTAFYNAVNGKGFNEGYGMQCVAGFKEFMYALSGKYVSTKTGGASGYASQQGQIEPLGFTWHSGTTGLKDGDWGIFGTGTYGHVAMYYQGKWFGQNQGASNASIGNAFNLLSIGSSGVLGYYRPNIYVSQNTASNTTPTKSESRTNSAIPVSSSSYTVQQGDTLGGISLAQGWWTTTKGLYGDTGYAQRLADKNSIQNRGIIYPNMVIQRAD